MRLSVELLDHIFSFLVVDHSTLISCLESDDPVLSPIAERYLYYSIIVCIGARVFEGTAFFKPDRLFQFLLENPRVKNHVRVLRVVDIKPPSDEAIRTFAEILVLFPNLEYISISPKGRRWPDVFCASLKGPLDLSSVKEVSLVGEQTEFPSWLLDRCENLTTLFLAGTFEEDDQAPCDFTPARLKSLLLRISFKLPSSSLNWIKLRINQLESLTVSSHAMDPAVFPVLLGACSATLKDFDISLTGSECYTLYHFQTQRHLVEHFPVFSPLPTNLQRLTIRMAIKSVFLDNPPDPKFYQSWLPAAAELIRRFIPHRPRHLVLDITFEQIADLTNIDISPLAVLEAASVSIPRIDLYASACEAIRFPRLPVIPITDARLMSALEKYTEVVKLINKGKISIHVEKIAP